ncbi:uncharacterized protein LOC117010953 [Catharus ustulatus]|uniref:uncharacterized protein LOC117010953 n=1 Tax=Catharus ustulatus TaxID=91951 RepID=UPI00140D3315|nr:uncharacterized protein LOC117010953 [Catharus ustulatus]
MSVRISRSSLGLGAWQGAELTPRCRELCAHSSLEQGTPVRRSQRWGHRTRCCPGWTSLVSDSNSLGGRGASASPAQLRTGKSITLLPSLPKSVVFEQPKPGGFSTRALPWRAPGPACAVGEKNTNSQPFGPDSPLQRELSTHPQRQVQHLKEEKQKEKQPVRKGGEAPCGMRPERASTGAGERQRDLPGVTRACVEQNGHLDDQCSASWNVDIPMQSCPLNTSCARNRQNFQGSSAASGKGQERVHIPAFSTPPVGLTCKSFLSLLYFQLAS